MDEQLAPTVETEVTNDSAQQDSAPPRAEHSKTVLKVFIISFLFYFLIGGTVHLIYSLFFAETLNLYGVFLNAPFVTLLSTSGAILLVSFGDGNIHPGPLVLVGGVLLLQIFVVSIVSYLILAKKLPEMRFKLLIVLITILAIFPFMAKIVYSPIQIQLMNDSNKRVDQEIEDTNTKYQDIPVKVVQDRLVSVEPYGLGYRLNKVLEIEVEIDSPVNAQQVGTDCDLFENVRSGVYRFSTDQGYPTGPGTKVVNETLRTTTNLVQGKNTLIYRFGFQDVQSLEGKPTAYEKDSAGAAYLLRNGPYTVLCRLMSFNIDTKYYQTRVSGSSLQPAQLKDEYWYSQFDLASGLDAYTNSGLYVTKPYRQADFLQ